MGRNKSPDTKGYKDLGWMNSWPDIKGPTEYQACCAANHEQGDVDVGPPNRGMEHVVTCDICKIVCRYDSSD